MRRSKVETVSESFESLNREGGQVSDRGRLLQNRPPPPFLEMPSISITVKTDAPIDSDLKVRAVAGDRHPDSRVGVTTPFASPSSLQLSGSLPELGSWSEESPKLLTRVNEGAYAGTFEVAVAGSPGALLRSTKRGGVIGGCR